MLTPPRPPAGRESQRDETLAPTPMLSLLSVLFAMLTRQIALTHVPGDLPCCTGHDPTPPRCDKPPICGCKRPDVAVASCWGFDEEDATVSLQAALDSGAATVVVPFMGETRPWILSANGTTPPNKGAVQLRSNQQLILESGVELQAKRGAFFGTGDCLLQANLVENMTIIGYGATLRMWRADYGRAPYPRGEWRSGLSLRGVRNVGVFGLTIRETGGDGIYLDSSEEATKGTPPSRYNCENVVIRDVRSLGNYRQGASVIGAVNLTVSNSIFADTAGTPPSAGVDLEPDNPQQRISAVSFTNCTFQNNSGAGVDMFFLAFSNYSADVSATFTDCAVDGAGSSGYRIAGVLPNGPRGTIAVTGGSVRHTAGPGVALEAKSAARLAVKFAHVAFANTASMSPDDPGWSPEAAAMSPIWIDKLHKFNAITNMTVGGLELESCTISDDRKRPYMRVTLNSSIDRGVADVSGSVRVESPFAGACDVDYGSGTRQRVEVQCSRSR